MTIRNFHLLTLLSESNSAETCRNPHTYQTLRQHTSLKMARYSKKSSELQEMILLMVVLKKTQQTNPQRSLSFSNINITDSCFKFSDMFALLSMVCFCQIAAFLSLTAAQLVFQQYAIIAQLAPQIIVLGKNMQASQPWLCMCCGAD